ncbi:MAG TPA: hypothetical protein VFJ70_19540 [Burkholderiales bacterium]|nr:hypothetical protein [Burkholderiales bacterium]
MNPLTIGLLVESLRADRYAAELALWIKGQPNLRLALIAAPRAVPKPNLLWRLIVALERFFLRWNVAHRDHYSVRDLAPLATPVAPDDVDVVIGFGRKVPPLLAAGSRLGAITVLHGGFWECYERRPQTSFVIYRAGTGEVLRKGSFHTRFYYSLNHANVCKKSVAHLKQILAKLAASGEWPAGQKPDAAKPRVAPNAAQCVFYAGKLAARVTRKALQRVPMLNERWGISVIPGKWNGPRPWRAVTVRMPRGRYWADPFVYSRGGRTFCYVEDLDQRTHRGHITALEVIGTRVVEVGVALREPFHLSFPFLFEHQGELYMCPETSAAREVRVYRAVEFPLRWQLAQVLMRGVSAADPLIFEKGGRWWLLANIDEAETGDHCSELYLFSADSPLSTNWIAHPQNPLLIDSIGGRNGGLIFDGEKRYRLGQSQGYDRYGESLRVYEITQLSPERYAEQCVAKIKPDFRIGMRGMHHLSTDGATTVVDHATAVFGF